MKTIERQEAIEILRRECLARVDDEHSMCEIAARDGIMCRGFDRWSFSELKDKHEWIVKRRPHVTPAQLRELANRWQLARQFVNDEPLACDNQSKDNVHAICRGWDEFEDEDLARFVHELTGEEVRVAPSPADQTG